MKSIFLLAIVTVFSLAAFAAGGKSVSYKSGEETVQALLYTPAGKGPFPGFVVIHEWWGLNDWVKEQASKLADQGYVTLAIDLYRGKVATTPDLAHELVRGVAEDRAARDLHAAVEFLKSQKNVIKTELAPSAGVWGADIHSTSRSRSQPSRRTLLITAISLQIPSN